MNDVDDDYDHDDDAAFTKVSCGVTEYKYIQRLKTMRRKISIIYKRKPNGKLISPHNTMSLSLL